MLALLNTSLVRTFCGDYATAKAQADELVALANEKNAMQWKAFGMLDQVCVLTLAGKSLGVSPNDHFRARRPSINGS